jgi:hypothetical protein
MLDKVLLIESHQVFLYLIFKKNNKQLFSFLRFIFLEQKLFSIFVLKNEEIRFYIYDDIDNKYL